MCGATILKVRVTPCAGYLLAETELVSDNDVRAMSRQIMDLQNRATREALISLGWTPPKDGHPSPDLKDDTKCPPAEESGS